MIMPKSTRASLVPVNLILAVEKEEFWMSGRTSRPEI